jgi:hypothetical protein
VSGLKASGGIIRKGQEAGLKGRLPEIQIEHSRRYKMKVWVIVDSQRWQSVVAAFSSESRAENYFQGLLKKLVDGANPSLSIEECEFNPREQV